MEALANRLQKVSKHIGKWARRQGITCYRIYDMDMPEYPFCIDRYEGCLHIAEYKTRNQVDDEQHEQWLEACVHTIARTLAVPEENVYLKQRRRLDRRNEQYEKVATRSDRMIVQEQGLKFWVNLTDYLDTGLFLDHRPLRKTFGQMAAGKRVLNLFSYTGAFSVYAAAGGADGVTTVDLSNTYLQWAKDNFELNQLPLAEQYRFVQGDVMDFLKNEQEAVYDLVFVDPPAFSNSTRLKGTWDTQRDHAAMLQLTLRACKPGATIFFSNNLRNFVPDFGKLKGATAKDITTQTIPEDFRNKRIHHCYEIGKSQGFQ
ncbi:MAG: class I SAM-dependent methyltransferase [Edaphocola sp.]